MAQFNNFFRVNSTKTTCSFSVLNMISCRNRTNEKFFFPIELKYKQALHFLIRSSYGILHFGVITTENQEEKVPRWKHFLRMFSLLIIASATCLTNGMVKSFYIFANYHHAILHLKNTGDCFQNWRYVLLQKSTMELQLGRTRRWHETLKRRCVSIIQRK